MPTVPANHPADAAPVPGEAAGRSRRRPSGEPPPLPRHVPPSAVWCLAGLAVTVALWVALRLTPSLSAVTRADDAALRLVAHLRTPAATATAHGLDHLGSSLAIRVLAWATIVALVAFRRFPHLIAYLVALLAGSFLVTVVAQSLARMRPSGVAILGSWEGYANPSRPVAGLAIVLTGIAWTLVPAGRWRARALSAAATVICVLATTRLYLAVDHPTDVLAGVAVGWALPALVYMLGTPDEAFPVTYRRGRRAHLDIGGARGEAIRRALAQQLGLHLVSVEPFGLGGSAGSTPLRLTVRRRRPVADDAGTGVDTGEGAGEVAGEGDGGTGAEEVLFGKLYALNHVRSDRLYKLARSIRYGRLEDERPFSGVRRLVEYEDHLLRLFRDLGLPTPRPEGLVEITPEREYLVVMEYFDGARELGRDAVSDQEIDSGLTAVRAMWDAGVAHRDIKPSNLLTRDGRILLIDLGFGAVRPTPWRQAVDLANMMLTLALESSPERVYRRALLRFTPDDVAEAFAASRGVTVPAQLKGRLRADGRHLTTAFRRLAPPRSPVAIQRWTVHRVASTVGAAAAIAGAVWVATVYARAAGLL